MLFIAHVLGNPGGRKLLFSLMTLVLFAGILTGCAGVVKSAATGGSNPTPLSITTTSLPSGNLQSGYTGTIAVSGGIAPYHFSVSSGALPTGLSLGASTGQISGTPTQSGTVSFTVQVTDSGTTFLSATQALSITVSSAPVAVSITSGSLANGIHGTPYNATLSASGGTTPYSWSVTGSLPAGLSLNASTGVISGTPTASGTSSFTVKVTDSSSPAQSATANLSIAVTATGTPLSITTASLAGGTQGTAYSATLAAKGGATSYSWSVTGSLPAGLSLNASTGVISGTPTASGTSSFTVKVTDSGSPAQNTTAKLSISIGAFVTPVQIKTTVLPDGQTGNSYSATLAATGGKIPYAWSISSGSLPSGLSLSSSGQISGTPSAAESSSFTVEVTDSSSPSDNALQVLSLVISTTQGSSVGCGATAGGAAQYDQSQCGNVAPYPSAPSSPTAISACGSYGAGTYQLTAKIGSNASANCITWTSGPVILDFNGFTITGQMLGFDITLSGTHLYSSRAGGGLTCAIDNVTNSNYYGCIWVQRGEGTITSATEIDHLTISNTVASTGTNGGRVLMIDGNNSTASNLGAATSFKIHNITSSSSTGTGSNRIVNLQIQSNKDRVEYSYNDVTCLAAANACQGVICYATTDCKIHNNRSTAQLSSGVSETSRLANCDGEGNTQGVLGCEINNNYLNVNDARGVRFRVVKSGVNPTLVHDNLIDNIQNGSSGSYVAAFHLCDPDSGTDDGSTYNIYSNTLRFAGGASGNGLMARGCTGFPIFQNNTIVCISGSCDGMLTNNRQGYGPGTLAIMNNDPVPLASNPQNNVESGNTTNYCSSGSMGGTGTATSITCP